MAWQSKFGSQFTRPVVRQAIAIINRDIQAALDYVSGVSGLYKPFVQYDMAMRPVKQFPALLLSPQSMKIDPAYDAAEKHDTRIYCAIAVAHQDPNAAAEQLEVYLNAVHEVLISAFRLTVYDWYDATIPLPAQPAASSPFAAGSTSPGLPANSLKYVFDEGWGYDELRAAGKEGFAKAAVISWMFTLFET